MCEEGEGEKDDSKDRHGEATAGPAQKQHRRQRKVDALRMATGHADPGQAAQGRARPPAQATLVAALGGPAPNGRAGAWPEQPLRRNEEVEGRESTLEHNVEKQATNKEGDGDDEGGAPRLPHGHRPRCPDGNKGGPQEAAVAREPPRGGGGGGGNSLGDRGHGPWLSPGGKWVDAGGCGDGRAAGGGPPM